MDCPDVDDLLPAYALGSATAEERAEVDRHLATCRLHSKLEDFQQVAAALPMSIEPVAPGNHVKQRLMARVYRDLEPSLGGRVWRKVWGWVAAAVLAVVALGLGIRDYVVSEQLATAPAQWLLTPTGPGASATGTLVWLPAQHTASLTLEQLPSLPTTDVYEVWLIKGGQPEPAGVFRPSSDNSASVIVKGEPSRYDTVAVTREPAPNGSQAPTTQPFIAASIR